mgnify:FL=1
MNEEELKALNKQAKRCKRIATEFASEVHDLVEDRLWSDYEMLPEIAEKVRVACIEWKQAKEKFESAELNNSETA